MKIIIRLASAFWLLVWSSQAFAVEAHDPVPEFERMLASGHEIWSEEEQASIIAAAVAHVPEITQQPRIAGTTGRISAGNISGYYGGVWFGPITRDGTTVEYLSMTIWGDADRWWRFDHEKWHRIVQIDGHSNAIWLEPGVQLEYAAEILEILSSMQAQGSSVALTTSEIEGIRQFRRSYYTPPDVIYENMTRHWYERHFIISAYSQPNGWIRRGGVALAQFAEVEDGLQLVALHRNVEGEWVKLE